nr:hypothetical protein [Tanacetum cinerariifolium]
MSFDTSASPRYVSGLGRASLAKVVRRWDRLDYGFVVVDMRRMRLDRVGFDMIVDEVVPFDVANPVSSDFANFVSTDVANLRHPDSVVTDLKPLAGSYSQVDVRRLSDFVKKLRDMPEGVSTGSEVHEKVHHDVRPTLQRRPFYCTLPAATNVAIPTPTLEDLAAATPNTKVLAKAEASKKQRVSTSGIDPIQSDDDDACVEIPLITSIYSAITIHVRGNQSGGYVPSATEGPSNRGKAIMDDAAGTPFGSVGRSLAFTRPAVRDPTGDVIDRDFFPFVPGPYYVAYHEDDVVAGSYEVSREQWEGPHEPIPSILTKEMFKDPNVCKTVVDQFPTPEEMGGKVGGEKGLGGGEGCVKG